MIVKKGVQVKIIAGKDKGKSNLFVDKASFKDQGSLRFFWLKSVMHTPNKRRKKDQKREVRLYHALDCQQTIIYPPTQLLKFNGEDKLVDEMKQSLDKIDAGKRPIAEIPLGDLVYEAVCNKPLPKDAPKSSKQPTETTKTSTNEHTDTRAVESSDSTKAAD